MCACQEGNGKKGKMKRCLTGPTGCRHLTPSPTGAWCLWSTPSSPFVSSSGTRTSSSTARYGPHSHEPWYAITLAPAPLAECLGWTLERVYSRIPVFLGPLETVFNANVYELVFFFEVLNVRLLHTVSSYDVPLRSSSWKCLPRPKSRKLPAHLGLGFVSGAFLKHLPH